MVNRNYTTEALTELIKATVSETLAATGHDSGEVSQSQAKRIFGRWFIDAMEAGRIRPISSGKGNTSTKWYSILEIRALRAADCLEAEIQTSAIRNLQQPKPNTR
jgi:hypothetical protein